MSQSFLLRKALTTTEAPLLIAASRVSYFFRTLELVNQNNSTVHVFLGITAGRAFLQQGDFLLYHFDINGYSKTTLENVLVPDGHELRGYAGTADSISLIGSGIMGY